MIIDSPSSVKCCGRKEKKKKGGVSWAPRRECGLMVGWEHDDVDDGDHEDDNDNGEGNDSVGDRKTW